MGVFAERDTASIGLAELHRQGFSTAVAIHRAGDGTTDTSGRLEARVRRYERWLLKNETFVIVKVRASDVERVIEGLKRSGPNSSLFIARELRVTSWTKGASEKPLPFRERLATAELAQHAARLAEELRTARAKTRVRGRQAYQRLLDLEVKAQVLAAARADLTDAARHEVSISPAAEWLLDNAYLIEGLIGAIEKNLPRAFYRRLPVIDGGEEQPRVHRLAEELLAQTEAQVNAQTVVEFLAAFQERTPLTMGELWAFPLMLEMQIIAILASLAERVDLRQREREESDFWANRLLAAARGEPEDLLLLLAELAREVHSPSPNFAIRLAGHLQDEATVLFPVENWIERKLGLTMPELIADEKSRQAAHQLWVANAVTSLRELSKLDWNTVFSQVCLVEKVLAEDPAGVFAGMDFDTRDDYRHAVEGLADSAVPELEVAARALELARRDAGADDRRRHVGYYLVDRGRVELEALLGTRPAWHDRLARWLRARAVAVHVGSFVLFTTALLLASAAVLATFASGPSWAWAVFGALLLVPASELAVQVLNYLVTRALPPKRLPRMRFEDGIPESCRTLVVVPVILRGPASIDEEVEHLEVRYLANRDDNLFFGLLTDFPDCEEERSAADDRLLASAEQSIARLNERHPGRFFLFHRNRTFCRSEGRWLGWERKRGKIEQLNRLLSGDPEPELRKLTRAGDPALLTTFRHVITLDADTQLPPGTAWRLIATAAHPLNRPRVSPVHRRVEEGYTVIQPRVGTSLPSANATPFARLFTEASGTDPYTHVVSDVYQDLFSEGSYHGKGLYDARVFHEVLTGRFPEATLLSHDLIEGAHVRVGYASDIELLDSFPPSYFAYAARQHRWIRGDWQVIGWLFPGVPGRDGKEPNPLRAADRWKIFDNLRRSLVPPAMVILVLSSWLFPAPGPAVAAAVTLAALFFPAFAPLLTYATSRTLLPTLGGLDLWRGFLRAALWTAFLPHQAALALDAIARVAYRKLVSGKRLLAWDTAQATQALAARHRRRFLARMAAASAAAVAAGAAAISRNPASLVLALPFLALWLAAPGFAWALSFPRRPASKAAPLPAEDRRFLRQVARRTWRYFDEFVGPETSWLPPDNFQEALRVELALRTSPTNIGLWLLSCLTARDLGYLTGEDFIDRSLKTVEKLSELERHRGHLFNWYDLKTLEPLRPRYVSTVDSGNLIACLWALAEGIEDVVHEPLITRVALEGLQDTLRLAEEIPPAAGAGHLRPARASELEALLEACSAAPLDLIRGWDDIAALAGELEPDDGPAGYWFGRLRREVSGWQAHAGRYLGWAKMALAPPPEARAALREELETLEEALRGAAPSLAILARGDLPALRGLLAAGARSRELPPPAAAWLEEVARAAFAAQEAAAGQMATARELAERSHALAKGMDLRFLYAEEKKLFTIGVDLTEHRRDGTYYDLLASEARLASFVAVADGQVPVEHWLALGRPIGSAGKRKVLLSWSGSMFEYLMPLLLKRTHPGSLLDHAARTAVERQIEYGEKRGIPWGISESAYSGLDLNHIYQYRAFGVPGLGLKRGLEEDLVVAPYATALALPVARDPAIANLRRLARLGLLGPRGFYEAIDYTRQSRRGGSRGVVVFAYLSHHQGMTLLALDNALNRGIHRRRFHADPRVRAAEPLLFEKAPAAPAVLAPAVEERRLARLAPIAAVPATSRFDTPFTPIPRTHLLANGSYSLMLTNAGGGYSRWRDLDITRWRADTTRDAWGSFLYVEDRQARVVWSAAYQPVRRLGRRYGVTFTADRAEFRRRDGEIETTTEVVVSPEDDVEIRRVTILNASQRERSLELTSYLELALAPHAADRAHPAFLKLFVSTEALPADAALLATRKPRAPDEAPIWVAHFVTEKRPGPGFEFETDRARFLGRRHGLDQPPALGGPLSGSAGHVLDPIFSIRRRIEAHPGEREQVFYVTAAAESREKVLALVAKYRQVQACERAFELAWVHSQLQLRYLGIDTQEAQRYQELASHLLYPNARMRPSARRLRRNMLAQNRLWGHGISGDLPIIAVRVSEAYDLNLVRELLLAHRYLRERGLKVDLAILNEEDASYDQPLHGQVAKLIQVHSSRMGVNQPGGVFVRSIRQLPDEEMTLILAAARVTLIGARGSLAQQLGPFGEARELPPPLEVREAGAGHASVPLPDLGLLQFANGIGGFTADGYEYVVNLREREATPAPWANVIATPACGTIVTERAAGTTWVENSQAHRLTSWSNDPVLDPPSQALYIRDEDSGEYWTATPEPVHGGGTYRVRHGQGYSLTEHASHGIAQELLVFVPIEDGSGVPLRIERLRLRNTSRRARRLTVTAYVEWVLGVEREETQPHVYMNWDPESGALLARNAYQAEYGSRIAFAVLSPRARSFTADRCEFLGTRGSPSRPAALDRSGLSGRTQAGVDPASVLQCEVEFEPGAVVDVLHLVGEAVDVQQARQMTRRFAHPSRVAEAWERTRAWWQRLLGAVAVETPDQAVNLLLNRWLLYQTLSSRVWGRCGFYQSSGAYGFRDQLQDVLALVHAAPQIARDHLLRAASRQFLEGDVQHWWHPRSGGGVRTRSSDDLLWLPYAVAQFVRVTGDFAILDARAPFLDGRPLAEGEDEAFLVPGQALEDGSLFEHCRRAIERGFRLGPHGLPLMGTGDWNDGMNRVGREGKGESVWLAWFLIEVLNGFAELAERQGQSDLAVLSRKRAAALAAAVETHAWDGEWYLRAFFDEGTPLGSRSRTEARIDSLAQSWAVLAGAADPQRARAAMEAVERHLIREQDGLVLLLTPPFRESDPDPGYIRSYPPGVRENGGQYTHAAIWVAAAFARLGDGDRAHRVLGLLGPIAHALNREQVERYKVEPYAVPADIYSLPGHCGRGGWTWYTGSAGWLYRVWLEEVLGFRLRGSTLEIRPCIPAAWPEYSLRFRYRRSLYVVVVENPEGVSSGVAWVEADGARVGRVVDLVDDGAEHRLRVRLGTPAPDPGRTPAPGEEALEASRG